MPVHHNEGELQHILPAGLLLLSRRICREYGAEVEAEGTVGPTPVCRHLAASSIQSSSIDVVHALTRPEMHGHGRAVCGCQDVCKTGARYCDNGVAPGQQGHVALHDDSDGVVVAGPRRALTSERIRHLRRLHEERVRLLQCRLIDANARLAVRKPLAIVAQVLVGPWVSNLSGTSIRRSPLVKRVQSILSAVGVSRPTLLPVAPTGWVDVLPCVCVPGEVAVGRGHDSQLRCRLANRGVLQEEGEDQGVAPVGVLVDVDAVIADDNLARVSIPRHV